MSYVITVDGTSGSGKGTVAALAAKKLGFDYLDSGLLYRMAAVAALRDGAPENDGPRLGKLIASLDLRIENGRALLDGQDVTALARSVEVGAFTSKIAVNREARAALLQRQRDCARRDLVCDGRAMAWEVFPNADLKVFMDCDPALRALRRARQLGLSEDPEGLRRIEADLRARDERDSARAVFPNIPAPGSLMLDSAKMTIEQAVDAVADAFRSKTGARA